MITTGAFLRHFIFIFSLVTATTAHAQCLSGNCENGSGSAAVSPDIIYTGSFKNGLPDGKGVFYNAVRKIYEGDVHAGLYNGTGTKYYDNGSVYVGTFKNGLREGAGSYRTLTETFTGNFHHDALDGKFAPEDPVNKNGIYTIYGQPDHAYMGADRAGIYNGAECSIFNVRTGALEEITTLNNSNEPDRNILYLDFGAEFYDRLNGRSLLPMALNSYTYFGKNNAGRPLFASRMLNTINIVTLTRDLQVQKLTSVDISAYKLERDKTINAVAPDLSRIAVNGVIINTGIGKKTEIKGIESMAKMVFSPGGDSVKIYSGRSCKIYSSDNGKELFTVSNATALHANNSLFSNNFYSVLADEGKGNSGLIFVENVSGEANAVPLLNPSLTFAGAADAAVDAQIASYEENRAFQERQKAKYETEMAARYGPNWRSGENMRTASTPVQKKKEHRCSFCRGSGVISIPGSGTSLEQDRTSGRWYKVVGSDKGECPMCRGTGYLDFDH